MSEPKWPSRPRSGKGNRIGSERYALLSAAFSHVQKSICENRYLEAITVLESILTDRLGSLVHGSLGEKVTLQDTLGSLLRMAAKNTPIMRSEDSEVCARKRRSPFPEDLTSFLHNDLARWWDSRNYAVHGMAKVHHASDTTFNTRYANLASVALRGVVVLLQLDAFDQRERKRNGAGPSATWPYAFRVTAKVRDRLADLDCAQVSSPAH